MKQLFFFLILCVPLIALAQIDEDFSRFRQNEQEQFGQFVRDEQKKFSSYRDSLNKRYAQELQKEWQSKKITLQTHPFATPQPPVVAPQSQNVIVNSDLPVKEILASSHIDEKESLESVSLLSQSELSQEAVQEQYVQSFSVYGNKFQIGTSTNLLMPTLKDLNEYSVASLWRSFSADEFIDLVQKCDVKRKNLKMCDWASFITVSALAEQLYPHNHRERVVFVVFSLNQMGFDARMGMAEMKNSHNRFLVCLLHIKQDVYRTPLVTVEGKDYYVFLPGAEKLGEIASIETYETDLTERQKPLNLKINHPFVSTIAGNEEVYAKDFKDKNMKFSLDENLLDFYADYPSTDLSVYASSQPSEAWVKQVDAYFKPILEGKSQQEAVGLLLDFLYQSFEYVTDEEQFGREKYFFCEENFFYKGNDCEDRAILFSFLVRHLLDLDVVLLNYDGHVATAVCFTEPNVTGDAYKVKGKRYIVCDPTYINAGIGRSMPEFRDKAVEIIVL